MPDSPIYIDGVEKIQWLSGMVRIEFFYNNPTEYDDKNHEKAAELVMNPDGFISLLNAVQQTADMMVEKGIFAKQLENNGE